MDTIMIIRDSVAMCVNKTAEIYQPCVQESDISWQAVLLVGIICATFIILVVFIVNKVIAYKACKHAEEVKHKEALEAQIQKKQAELLEYLKGKSTIVGKNENGEETKTSAQEFSDVYTKKLEAIIENTKNG